MEIVELKMPSLEPGRIYQAEDLVDHLYVDGDGTSDYNLTSQQFPFKKSAGRLVHDALSSRPNEAMVVRYQVLALSDFNTQLRDLEQLFERGDAQRDAGTVIRRREKECDRVQIIADKLLRGEVIYPVFIQQNDPYRRIIEGNHRAVALYRLGWNQLPVLFAGYADWF
jgi:hypothetical protein